MLTITVLGYPSITLHQSRVTDFISQKALVLLCYLALEPQPHARERLAGLFWGEMAQDRALSNLRQALHNLQKLLPDTLTVTRQTVQWTPSMPCTLDVDVLAGGQIAPDLRHYTQPFLAGVAIDDAQDLQAWIDSRARHFEQLAGGALLRTLENATINGDAALARAAAAALVEQNPYHELHHQHLWRVLMWQGDAAGALQSYHALAKRLLDELGIEPGSDTRQFAQRIECAQTTPRHNLPMPDSAFIGREHELLQVTTRLRQPETRLITLTGVGGIGKSRLAQQVAWKLAPWFINGVRWVSLGSLTSTLDLPALLAEALGIPLRNALNPLDDIVQALTQMEILLVFDQAEHIPDFANFAARLLAAPDLRMLVTSREPLYLREEWVFPLEGMPASADTDAGVLLLNHTAQRAGASPPVAGDALALCQQLERLPLAIEIAAALLDRQTAGDMLDTVRRNLDALQAPWRNIDPRQRTLRALFTASWLLLSQEEQRLLSNLALFHGTFDREAAVYIAEASPPLLESLRAKSLVMLHDERYRLHNAVRFYADEHMQHRDALTERFQAFYLRHAQAAETLFSARQSPQAVATIRKELDGIRQCWATALAARDLAAIGRMMPTLHRFYEGSGWFVEGVARFQAAADVLMLDVMQPEERQLAGRLLSHRAGLLLRLGSIPDALQVAHDSVLLLSQSEDAPAYLAFAFNTLGIAQLYTGDRDQALVTLETCASLYRTLAMPDLLKPLVNLGALYTRTGDHVRALAVLEEAQPLALRLGDQMGGYHIANALGVIHGLRSEYARAIEHYEQALALSEAVGFMQGQSLTLNNLGDSYGLLGQPQQGISYAQRAVALAEHLHDQRSLCHALNTLTLNMQALNLPEASTMLRSAVAAALETGAEPLLLIVLFSAGNQVHASRPDTARCWWQIVAEHPATEADYRRRAVEKLPADVPAVALPQSMIDLMHRVLESLETP